MASIVAYFSVRKADEPADRVHPYGHAKVENLAAAIEGMLILVGAGMIIFESVRRLVGRRREVESLGVGIAVIGFSAVANIVVSSLPLPPGARDRLAGARGRRRAPAHRRRHLGRRAGRRSCWSQVTGVEWLDPVVALVVAVAIVVAGVRILIRSSRVLVDEALPDDELDAVARGDRAATAPPRSPASTSCAPAGRAAAATSTCTCSSATGTTLRRAHELGARAAERDPRAACAAPTC